MKLLINVPAIFGGVSNHYRGLRPYWSEQIVYHKFGRRSNRLLSALLWLPFDLTGFVLSLILRRPDRVLLNPSLNNSAIRRDMLYLRISTFLKVGTCTFIHGWDEKFEDQLDRLQFAAMLNRCVCVITLADKFREKLIGMNVTVPIFTITTKVDDRLLEGFDVSCRTGQVKNLLFLARVEREKGVFMTLDAFAILEKKYPAMSLTVAGDGAALDAAKRHVKTLGLEKVVFTGLLKGKAIAEAYRNADIYIFPTTHYEGMPASVLEAMAFGLPVITRPVGGLVDFFTNDMGRLIESHNPDDFARAVEEYACNAELTRKTGQSNHKYATQRFLASKVAKKIEQIISEAHNNKG
jgi:glycosyltransferase involved in cell wall biosynthesis